MYKKFNKIDFSGSVKSVAAKILLDNPDLSNNELKPGSDFDY